MVFRVGDSKFAGNDNKKLSVNPKERIFWPILKFISTYFIKNISNCPENVI